MKSFSERNPIVIGAIGIGITILIAVTALQYDKLPFLNSADAYSAYFAEAGGLAPKGPVEVAGARVGSVTSVDLDGPRVLVKFTVDHKVRLGDHTEATIRAKSLLGAKVLQLAPRGNGRLSSPIPLNRTKPPYQLPDAVGDLAATISGLNTDDLSHALATLSDTFKDTPPALRAAVDGVTRFSKTLGDRDAQLRALLSNANKVTGVLAERADKITSLVQNTNAVLVELQRQQSALDSIMGNISAISQQLTGFIRDNRAQLHPALDKLNGVLTILDDRKTLIQESIKLLNQFAMSLGEVLASGPFFKAYIGNLLPGQFIQPFIDAAFSDLGLDPHVLSPTDRIDPPTGQPATPPLPAPYPRTGQGGPPALTIPDAITGNPGDHPCGPPGIPLPGPGCYPAREPAPAPAPGGPPPGPPAAAAPTEANEPAPSTDQVTMPAPGEQRPPGAPPAAEQGPRP